MEKKGACCYLTSLLIILVMVTGVFAFVFFGGNYFLKKLFGNEGELLKLEINNWVDLFYFIKDMKELTKEKPEIDEIDKPSQENLNSAKDWLKTLSWTTTNKPCYLAG